MGRTPTGQDPSYAKRVSSRLPKRPIVRRPHESTYRHRARRRPRARARQRRRQRPDPEAHHAGPLAVWRSMRKYSPRKSSPARPKRKSPNTTHGLAAAHSASPQPSPCRASVWVRPKATQPGFPAHWSRQYRLFSQPQWPRHFLQPSSKNPVRPNRANTAAGSFPVSQRRWVPWPWCVRD